MNQFEFFAKIVNAAYVYKTALEAELAAQKAFENGLPADASVWHLGDTTGQAAEAANKSFGVNVANVHATAWDDKVAHVVMWVAELATSTDGYLDALEEELREAHALVVAATQKVAA